MNSSEKTVWHDLNAFIPFYVFFVVAVKVFAPAASVAIFWGLTMFGLSKDFAMQIGAFFWLLLILVSFPLLFLYSRNKQFPEWPAAETEKDWRQGHIVTAVGNTIVIFSILLEISNSMVRGTPFYGFFIFAVLTAIPFWMVGWRKMHRWEK